MKKLILKLKKIKRTNTLNYTRAKAIPRDWERVKAKARKATKVVRQAIGLNSPDPC